MSRFSVPIVEIKGWGKHKNADTLAITEIQGHPVIFKLGEFDTGSRCIFIPEESLLPNTSFFSFLWKDKNPNIESHRVVNAVKLRGIFSCGIIIPIPESMKELPTGTDVSKLLGIEKYEKPEPVVMGGDNESRPGWFPVFTDIESLRKYHHILIPGERIILTEKIHGCNASYCWYDNRLWISSHKNVKKLDGKTCWNQVARKYQLDLKLQAIPGVIIFGEVYGNTQKGFQYDSPNKSSLVVFDAYSIKDQKYFDFADMREMANYIGLRIAPVLYQGEWSSIEDVRGFAEGPSVLGNGRNIREGFVLRVEHERDNNETERVILKFHGEGYLLRKGKKMAESSSL